MLTRLLTQFGYVAIGGLLVAGGLGVPVPEELIQLTAGYLARRELLGFTPVLMVAYGGIVTGDLLLFKLAQRHGERVLDWLRIGHLLTPQRRARLESHFARHAFLTVMIARHMSGLRLPAYVLAATHRVRARTFFLADALSALLSVPLVVSLGYLFAARIEEVKRRVQQVELLLVVAACLLALVYLLRRRRRARGVNPKTGPQNTPTTP